MRILVLLLSLFAILTAGELKSSSHANHNGVASVQGKSVHTPSGKFRGSALLTEMEVNFNKSSFSLSLKGLVNQSVANVSFTMNGLTVHPDQKNVDLIKFIASFKIPSLTVAGLKISYNPKENTIEAAILGFRFHARKV